MSINEYAAFIEYELHIIFFIIIMLVGDARVNCIACIAHITQFTYLNSVFGWICSWHHITP